MFGRMLKARTEEQGIDMSALMMDDVIHTTLAFVEKLPDGDRDFSFYRKPGADIMLTKDEVIEHKDVIEGAKIFHFGTLSMTLKLCGSRRRADASFPSIRISARLSGIPRRRLRRRSHTVFLSAMS